MTTMSRRAVGAVADLLNWPRRAMCWHEQSLVTAGNALEKTANNSQRHNLLVRQNAAADGDTFTNGFLLRPGTYTMSVLGVVGTDAPIIDWYIDDTIAVTGQDWYAGAPAFNGEKTATVQVKGASPYHVLKGVVNGKNASSSAYNLYLTCMWFNPSAD